MTLAAAAWLAATGAAASCEADVVAVALEVAGRGEFEPFRSEVARGVVFEATGLGARVQAEDREATHHGTRVAAHLHEGAAIPFGRNTAGDYEVHYTWDAGARRLTATRRAGLGEGQLWTEPGVAVVVDDIPLPASEAADGVALVFTSERPVVTLTLPAAFAPRALAGAPPRLTRLAAVLAAPVPACALPAARRVTWDAADGALSAGALRLTPEGIALRLVAPPPRDVAGPPWLPAAAVAAAFVALLGAGAFVVWWGRRGFVVATTAPPEVVIALDAVPADLAGADAAAWLAAWRTGTLDATAAAAWGDRLGAVLAARAPLPAGPCTLVLRLAAALEAHPWELARAGGEYLARRPDTSIVREVDGAAPGRGRMRVRRVVFASAQSADEPLDIEQERRDVRAAWPWWWRSNVVRCEPCEPRDLEAGGPLRDGDALHLVAHAWLREAGGVALLLTSGAHAGVEVDGAAAARLMAERGVTLAVFNVCASAAMAREVVAHGAAAAVGTNGPVLDRLARELAPALYRALVAGRPLPAAMAAARAQVALHAPGTPGAFAVPVLYRARDRSHPDGIDPTADGG